MFVADSEEITDRSGDVVESAPVETLPNLNRKANAPGTSCVPGRFESDQGFASCGLSSETRIASPIAQQPTTAIAPTGD